MFSSFPIPPRSSYLPTHTTLWSLFQNKTRDEKKKNKQTKNQRPKKQTRNTTPPPPKNNPRVKTKKTNKRWQGGEPKQRDESSQNTIEFVLCWSTTPGKWSVDGWCWLPLYQQQVLCWECGHLCLLALAMLGTLSGLILQACACCHSLRECWKDLKLHRLFRCPLGHEK